jgi:GH25 family lysozyme M1 (1,4-beta-N-acetylmuramidase)
MADYLKIKFKPKPMERSRSPWYVIHFILLLIVIALMSWLVYWHWQYDQKRTAGPVDESENSPIMNDSSDTTTNQDNGLYMGHSYKDSADYQPLDRAGFEEMKENIRGFYGIDVSHWQKTIDWRAFSNDTIPETFSFAIIKATQGENDVDSQFERNWRDAQSTDLWLGAYHFFEYKDDPIKQAQNYIKNVDLSKGNIRPIVDLEIDCSGCHSLEVSKAAAIENIQLYLKEIENHYGIAPIIYTYDHFYNEYLKGEFDEYDFWMARYSSSPPEMMQFSNDPGSSTPPQILMWQFTDHESVGGITPKTDASFLLEQYRERLLIP